MYQIYHIPGVKIGCSINPLRRTKAQGYTHFEILETHNDKTIASQREIELQKKYGYKLDNSTYIQTLQFAKKAYTKTPRPIKRKTETIQERTIRLKKWHEDMKQRKVGYYDPQVSLRAGLVSKDKFSIPIVAYRYPTGEYVGEYTSAKHCQRELNLPNAGNIRNVLKGRGNSYKGYSFKYK